MTLTLFKTKIVLLISPPLTLEIMVHVKAMLGNRQFFFIATAEIVDLDPLFLVVHSKNFRAYFYQYLKDNTGI